MSQDKRTDVVISDEKDAAINAHINGLMVELMPILITLTAAKRSELFKLGNKNQGFLNKNLEYARQNPELIPLFMSLELAMQDVNANARLTSYARRLNPMMIALDDTVMLTGSQALQSVMLFYRNVKLSAENGVTKAKAIFEDLSTRFPGGRRKKTAPEDEATQV